MQNYLVLFVATVSFALTSIVQKMYTTKNTGKDKTFLFLLIESICVSIIYLIIYLTNSEWNSSVLIYSFLWGLFAVISLSCLLIAIKIGPLSLTSLLLQFSLILVTIYGLFFWGETLSTIKIIGLILIVISLIFNFSPDKNGKKINLKWLFFALVSMFGNAGTAIVQKQQQITFDGKFGNMMLLFSELFVVLLVLIILIFNDNKENKTFIKNYVKYPVMKSIVQASLNISIVFLATRLDSGIVYPVMTAGSLIIVYIMAITIYKEKISLKSLLGIMIAISGIVLLNI